MQFEDIIYQKKDGVAKIVINRPHRHNAFRTKTLKELLRAFEDAEEDNTIGVVILTGAGDKSFCTGGDAKEAIEQEAGYEETDKPWYHRLHAIIRRIPKPVIAAVNGWCIGGGNVLNVLCDLTIASETARFGQAGPKVGSFAAGFATAYLARVVGEKKAREIWFLCRQYTAQEALEMGLVNKVVPPDKLEEEVDAWCREILALAPLALKFLKVSFNADSQNILGIEEMGIESVREYWKSEEAAEGRRAYLDKRKPDFSKFRR